MINVIKHGKPKQPKDIIRRFDCKSCGCIFEASEDECVIHMEQTSYDPCSFPTYNSVGFCKCPDCGANCIGTIVDSDGE